MEDKTRFVRPGIILPGKAYWNPVRRERVIIAEGSALYENEISLEQAVEWANSGELLEVVQPVGKKLKSFTPDAVKAIAHSWTCYKDQCEEDETEPDAFDDWFDKNY